MQFPIPVVGKQNDFKKIYEGDNLVAKGEGYWQVIETKPSIVPSLHYVLSGYRNR